MREPVRCAPSELLAARSTGWDSLTTAHCCRTCSLQFADEMPITRVLAAFCVLFCGVSTVPCLNGGLPVYTRGQLKCQCSSNFFWGERCQFAVSKLRTKRCINGGVYAKDKCLCRSGYEGVNCELPICGVHGIRSSANRSRCECESGHYGEFCEITFSTSNCKHGVQQHGKCVCRHNYQGEMCDWPNCGKNGRVDAATKKCQCYQHFAPPFCQTCVAGFWGKTCALRTVGGADKQRMDDGSTGALPNEYFHARFGALSWLVAASLLICLTVACSVAVCRLRAEAALWNAFGSRQSMRTSYSCRRRQRLNTAEMVALSTATICPPAYETAMQLTDAPPSYEDVMRIKTA